ncbi:hypothetical protein BDE36_2381 [Arcticibacter tournemirensis]|nr:hypothetical protein BDE36_2381 [Arcticibacter tournemirensis]
MLFHANIIVQDGSRIKLELFVWAVVFIVILFLAIIAMGGNRGTLFNFNIDCHENVIFKKRRDICLLQYVDVLFTRFMSPICPSKIMVCL